jgi:hypothetical protein
VLLLCEQQYFFSWNGNSICTFIDARKLNTGSTLLPFLKYLIYGIGKEASVVFLWLIIKVAIIEDNDQYRQTLSIILNQSGLFIS